MSTKLGKKYLDKNGLSYFRQKLKEELKNEQLWTQGENVDGTEGGVQIAYYGNAVGEASVSEGVAYNYKKSLDEIIPISIKSLSSEEKTSIANYIGDNNYNYVIKLDFSSIDDPVTSSLYDLCNEAFNLSMCEYVENTDNTSISELSNVKSIMDITENPDIISIFESSSSDFSQLEITNNENLEWGLLELDDISVNKNSTYIIGISTGAFGVASHSEGYYTTANGDYSHSEGNISSAEGVASHSEGSFTHAEGSDSHAEGYSTKANGRASHAEGAFSHAEGYGSHAEGSASHSGGYNSHAEGHHSITTNLGEHAEGRYNKSNTGTISSIGIGTSDTDRKNAVEVMTNGDIYVNGIGDYDGTNSDTATTLQDYISNIETTQGPGLEYDWDGTLLGVRKEGDTDFEYTDLIGPEGPEGPMGPEGLTGMGFGYLGCTWVQHETIMKMMYLDESGDLQTLSNENDEIPENCIGILDKFPGLSAEYFSYWFDNIYNWLTHTSNTFVFEKYLNYLKEIDPVVYTDIDNYINDIATQYNFLFVLSNIETTNSIVLPIAPWGDFGTVGNGDLVFGGNIHSYRGGNSILFYEDGITTDTDNKADVPTGFSVRVGDLVIDENFNLYKCIEE